MENYMIKANNCTTRRALLAGAPAAAAAALAGGTVANAVAIASVKAAEADPIFAVIDLHRRAWRAYKSSYAKFLKLDNYYRSPSRSIVIGEYPERETEVVENTDDVFHWRRRKTGKMIPVTACCDHDIEKNAPWLVPNKADRAAWIEQQKAELRRHQDAINAAEAVTPRGKAFDVYRQAEESLLDMTERLIATRPITVSGIAAVLAYWAEFAVSYEEDENELGQETATLLNTAAAAARSIA
jgi:hypothetical protein